MPTAPTLPALHRCPLCRGEHLVTAADATDDRTGAAVSRPAPTFADVLAAWRATENDAYVADDLERRPTWAADFLRGTLRSCVETDAVCPDASWVSSRQPAVALSRAWLAAGAPLDPPVPASIVAMWRAVRDHEHIANALERHAPAVARVYLRAVVDACEASPFLTAARAAAVAASRAWLAEGREPGGDPRFDLGSTPVAWLPWEQGFVPEVPEAEGPGLARCEPEPAVHDAPRAEVA